MKGERVESGRTNPNDDTVQGSTAMGIGAIALRGLLPHMTGELAEDAAEIIDNPDQPVRDMRASRGIVVTA